MIKTINFFKGKKADKKIMIIPMVIALLTMFATPVYGAAVDIGGVLNNVIEFIGWGMIVIGALTLLWGLFQLATSIGTNNPNERQNAIMMIIGGGLAIIVGGGALTILGPFLANPPTF